MQAVLLQFLPHLLLGEAEDFLEHAVGHALVDIAEEGGVVVLEVLYVVEVLEVFQRLVVGGQVGGPRIRGGHGIDQFGQVLHVLFVDAQTLGDGVVQFHAVDGLRDGLHVVGGQFAERYPVAVALALGTEGGSHADPVVIQAVGVQLLHHVAEAVVGRALERAVVAYLLGSLVDNLRESGHLLDADIDGGERRAARLAVGKRAHEGVLIGVLGGRGVDGGSREFCEALGSGLHVGGGDDADGGVGGVGLADGRLVGGVLPVVVGHHVVGQLAHHIPERGGIGHVLFGLLLGLLLFLLFGEFLVVVLAGGDAHAEAPDEGGHQPEVQVSFHLLCEYIILML